MEPLRHRAGRARAAEVREGAHVWCDVRSHGAAAETVIVLQKKRCCRIGKLTFTSGGERVPARRTTSPNRSTRLM